MYTHVACKSMLERSQSLHLRNMVKPYCNSAPVSFGHPCRQGQPAALSSQQLPGDIVMSTDGRAGKKMQPTVS